MMSVCECEQSSFKSPDSCGSIMRTNNLRTSAVCVHACVFMCMEGHMIDELNIELKLKSLSDLWDR